MSTDKRTIGVTGENESVLSELVREGHFGSELDAAVFAMAYAIKCGVKSGSAEGAETKWNVGTVDSDGRLRTLIAALYPECSEPYRFIEFLINEGLRRMRGLEGLPLDVVGILFTQAKSTAMVEERF